MRISLRLLSLLLLLLPAAGFSQAMSRMDSVEVTENSVTFRNPFSGGLNFPQYSPMQLDGDGIADLVVYDAGGEIVLTFLHPGNGSVNEFKFAPEYSAQFPRSLKQFVLMRDYNCDGKEDIFTSSGDQGIDVWLNTSSGGNLSFVRVIHSLQTTYGLGPVRLFVGNGDIPAIDDVDGDGDLDVLAFESGGQRIEWHKNRAQELGNCDTLVFEVADECWGQVSEAGTSNVLTLNVSCKGITPPLPALSSRHSGSCITSFDQNNDGDKDVLVSDLIYPSVAYLRNNGTATAAHIDTVDYNFPFYDFPVNIYLFPASFLYDVNHDGLDDLLVGPNGAASSVNYDNSWYYSNQGSVQNMQFFQERENFLINQMVDAGKMFLPALVDHNGDGLLDIAAGNDNFRFDSVAGKTQFRLYENTGTATDPAFELVSRNWSGVATAFTPSKFNLAPAFGDLDNDGDPDLVVGEYEGMLHYFENTATAGNPASYTLSQQNWFGIDPGFNSTPVLTDLDRDGDLDLVVGASNGDVNYYQNTGTESAPVFNSAPTFGPLGGIDVLPGGFTGFSAPAVFENSLGQYEIVVGTGEGRLYHYTQVEGNLGGTFTLADSSFGDIWEGKLSSPAAGDLNGDGIADFVVGNVRGGMSIYNGDLTIDRAEPVTAGAACVLFPNPSQGEAWIAAQAGMGIIESVEVFSLSGEKVAESHPMQAKAHLQSESAAGLYLVKVQLSSGRVSYLRWAINR